MTPQPHRHDDKIPPESHEVERESWFPSRTEWDTLKNLVIEVKGISQSNATDLCDINKALWGNKRDGINSDGGIVAEVRSLRNIKKIAWSAVAAAAGAILTSVTNWATGK